MESINRFALQRGREIGRSDTEIVYEDRAPGLTFVVSYEVADGELAFSTAVKTADRTGRLHFTVIRPFHRILAPVVPIITARRLCAVANRT